MERPLRVLIVDDEPLARGRARRMLEEIDGVEVTGEAGSAGEARRALAAQAPDVMLLDIQMPGEDGFALLAGLERRPAVIFATAFDQYAVKAFEENAVDYLLKPFRRERLEAALERTRRDLARPEDLSQKLAQLLGT
jgi:two-component system LytT family response regulator